MRITPVILAGGAGTRLWPLSRADAPKQFIRLLGDRTPFQEALLRVNDPDLFDAALVVTSDAYRFVAREQAEALGVVARYLLEPLARDSAMAVAAATTFLRRDGGDAVILTLAADHAIGDAAAFREDCRAGQAAAAAGSIVTFGIRPTRPETGYGYLAPAGDARVGPLSRFVEKPDAAAAARYIAEGMLWNSGNFLFSANTMAQAFAAHAPEIWTAAAAAVEGAALDLGFWRMDAAAMASAPARSIDYAVMEHAEDVAVVRAAFDWSDIGSWDSVWRELPHDAADNAALGAAHIVGGAGNLAHASGARVLAVVDVDNLAVISTDDAVLVTRRDASGAVKSLVAALEAQNVAQARTSSRSHRPWGAFQTVDQGDRHQVKRITVKPGGKLSLQRHYHRSEHWIVVRGVGLVTVDGVERLVNENESVYIPLGALHRLENPGKIALELIEVQTGSYLGEDDIIRLDDVYARAPKE